MLATIYVVLTGSAVTGAIASFVCLVGVAWRRGQPLSHILAPFVLLLVMGVRVIPLGLRAWRRAEDKKRLMKRHLLRVRRTPDGRLEE